MENELVFINPKKIDEAPFTTSAVVSERSGIAHRRVKDAIRKYQTELEAFGLLGAYQTESTGGRPEEFYKLNEGQATFLMTLLKNTPAVVAFKQELVRQFFAMRDKLSNVASARNDFKTLTEHIALIKDEPKAYHFSNECDLINRLATGMSARQFREAHGIRKGESIRPHLTPEQARMMDDLQRVDIGLLVAVPDFKERKAALTAYRDKRAALTSPTA